MYIKKALCLILTLCTIITAAALTGCEESKESVEGSDNTSFLETDVNYSKYSSTMLYDTIYNLYTGETSLDGKTVKIRSDYGAYYDYTTNSVKYVIEIYDATACCAAFYELRFADGSSLPAIGSRIEIVGTVYGSGSTGYIEVTAWTLINGSFDTAEIDIDATQMSLSDLEDFLDKINTVSNQYSGQTVRIFGHYEKNSGGYSYVKGFKSSSMSDTLTTIWGFELYSDSVEYPEVTAGYLNCYEIIGTITTYTASDGTWPCIKVQSIRVVNNYYI